MRRTCSRPSFPHHFIPPRIALEFVITGIFVIRGRDCGFHLGGVAVTGPISEGPVQECHVGELLQPSVSR